MLLQQRLHGFMAMETGLNVQTWGLPRVVHSLVSLGEAQERPLTRRQTLCLQEGFKVCSSNLMTLSFCKAAIEMKGQSKASKSLAKRRKAHRRLQIAEGT